MLQAARMKSFGGVLLEGTPLKRAVIPHGFGTFGLGVADGEPSCELTTYSLHLSQLIVRDLWTV